MNARERFAVAYRTVRLHSSRDEYGADIDAAALASGWRNARQVRHRTMPRMRRPTGDPGSWTRAQWRPSMLARCRQLQSDAAWRLP